MRYFVISIILALLSGCSTIGLQSKRIFQKEVVSSVRKVVTEDIRQAADYLSTELPENAVAVDLSKRVGLPKRAVNDAEDASAALRKGNRDYANALKDLNDWVSQNKGTALEGTGLSVWGTGGLLLIGGLIVFCVLMPALIPFFLKIAQSIAGTSLAVFKQTTSSIVGSVEEFKRENPDASKQLKEIIDRKMDGKGKALITKIKSHSMT